MKLKRGNNPYSADERKFMRYSQRLRAIFFLPLLRALHARGVTGNHLTLASLLTGLVAALVLNATPITGLFLIALHCLLDGLDGPLARHAGQASNRGSFTDTVADQLALTAIMLALMHGGQANAVAGGVFILSYTAVVGFAMIRNALGISYSWLVRPRFFVYAWIPVELYLWPGTLTWLLWACNALLLMKTATGFWKIREKL